VAGVIRNLALGSGIGGLLFAREHQLAIGYAAAAFILAGLALLLSTRPLAAAALTLREAPSSI
jgi:hypothetical protein